MTAATAVGWAGLSYAGGLVHALALLSALLTLFLLPFLALGLMIEAVLYVLDPDGRNLRRELRRSRAERSKEDPQRAAAGR